MWLCHLVCLPEILLSIFMGHVSQSLARPSNETYKSRNCQPRESPTFHRDNLTQIPSVTLSRRVALPPFLLNREWIIDHHDFTCLLPLSSAAADLQHFYEEVAAFAAQTSAVPLNIFSLVVGEITLEVRGPSGTAVSWLVVQAFANWLLDMTKRGYTNSYQINFVHRPTGQLLTFSLWFGYKRAATNTAA